jgi:hypothetical protein
MAAANSRPAEYTAEMAMMICDQLIDGKSLPTICARADMPDQATVLRWVACHEEFRHHYTLARDLQALDLMEEIIAIARDSSGDRVEKVRPGGKVVMVRDRKHLARCRLRIAVRSWVLDQMLMEPGGILKILSRLEAGQATNHQHHPAAPAATGKE